MAELLRQPCSRRAVSVEAELDGLSLSSAAVPAAAPVTVEVVLESLPHGLTVRGTVRAPWRGQCRRCLTEVQAEVTAEVREVFEARPVEGETYPLEGDHVDLQPMVRDAVLLALPMAPLCDERCPGPAPEAFPVTEGDGAAGRALADPRWASLDDLKFD